MFGEDSQIERNTGFAKLNAARKAKKEATGKKSKVGSRMLS